MDISDIRQYQLMKDYILMFENGRLTLDELIKDLYGLIQSLHAPEEEWKETFQSEWWTLEQVYAAALDRGEKVLNTESQDLVYETIENMKSLLLKNSSNS